MVPILLRCDTALYTRQYDGLTFNVLAHTRRKDILAISLRNPNNLNYQHFIRTIYIYIITENDNEVGQRTLSPNLNFTSEKKITQK